MTDKTDTQPEALRLATHLEGFFISEEVTAHMARKIAAELRRLYDECAKAQAQHDRDSRELRSLCKARDTARRERDAAKAENAAQAQQIAQLGADAAPADPMDWRLPCDVTVGHGTMGKGVPLRTLVMRMKVLYELATGHNADEVANRTPEQNAALANVFRAAASGADQGDDHG